MNRIKYRSSLSYIVLFAALITYAAAIITSSRYERLTGDATLYLSIAEKYLRGDFSNAINGYWGPLLSWLLIPLLYLGASHVSAINTLNLLFGLCTIIGVWRLSACFDLTGNLRSIVMICLVPILFFISLVQPMDFLLMCILVFYLNVVFRKDYPGRVSHALSAGFLGALAYFSKPYGLPFFLSHFLLISLCRYFANSSGEHRKRVIRNALAGLVMFSLLCGPWIALISKKYHHLTFSNMGGGVFASIGPGSAHDTLEKGDPIFFAGFFAPPNETAFVIYEDPSYAREKTWSPLESRQSFRHYISNLSENFFEGSKIYESYSRLSLSIVIAYMLLLFSQPIRTMFSRTDLLYPLLTIALYTVGYFPFHFETRYLWIVNILLLLMGGRVLHELFQNEFFKKGNIKVILIIFFVISFILTPIKSATESARTNINSEMHALGLELNSRYDIHGNIASNRQKMQVPVHDSWHKTFRLAYWLKSRYYGVPRENISDDELEQELRKYDIDYYFYWEDSYNPPQFLSRYRELTGGDIEGLKIYLLKDGTPR
jgi:hypothetical protein